MKPPTRSCSKSILVLANDECDLDLQEHPIVDKLLHLDDVQPLESVMDSLELFLFAFLLQLVSQKIFFVS